MRSFICHVIPGVNMSVDVKKERSYFISCLKVWSRRLRHVQRPTVCRWKSLQHWQHSVLSTYSVTAELISIDLAKKSTRYDCFSSRVINPDKLLLLLRKQARIIKMKITVLWFSGDPLFLIFTFQRSLMEVHL